MPSAGPLSASIVLVGDSPNTDDIALGQPFSGKAGVLLNNALRQAGIDRSQCYSTNVVPVKPSGDKFANHSKDDISWGISRFYAELNGLSNARVIVAFGSHATSALFNQQSLPVAQRKEKLKEGFIGQWRGSVLPAEAFRTIPHVGINEYYLWRTKLIPAFKPGQTVIPTYHPSAIIQQFTWHPWLILDLQLANRVLKDGPVDLKRRKWYFNDPTELQRLADSGVDLISVDTEMEPKVVAIATADELHVFEWREAFRPALTKLLNSAHILKVAHNWLHDAAWIRVKFGIEVQRPIFDTQGAAHVLNNALNKELSPHIASLFTNWPYHKWLTNHDQFLYCGMDAIVCYDAYWNQLRDLMDRQLYYVANHDHRLLTPLMDMQKVGFKIDESVRQAVEIDLEAKVKQGSKELQKLVQPVIDSNIEKFEKPHLFRDVISCSCCGGGALQRGHCRSCWEARERVGYRHATLKTDAIHHGFKTIKAFKQAWPVCKGCKGTGRVTINLEFNSDSPDQLGDVIYRGLKIKARKFKGKETTKVAQLEPIADKHPIVAKVVELAKIRAEYDTVERLTAGADGALHCAFDPFGTGSGRVAGSEGLVEVGTNPMNLPKAARRFVIPRKGYVFLYPDMAQVEARAMAVLSGDANLRKALYEVIPALGKADYHTWLLQAITNYDGSLVLSRDQSKRVSYAGFYGARAIQLAKELTAEALRKKKGMVVDARQAEIILQVLYKICPELPRWQQSVADEVLRTRKLRNPFTGRERTWLGYLADSKTKGLKYEIAKEVWSFPPQDMGAWVLGLGLEDMYYNSGEWGKLLQPLIHVHDALLIECPADRLNDGKALAQKILTRYIWNMDFPADMKVGQNWLACS